tara:strand:+ start:1286 stop:1501 length:216 start_codon:yes stop_codon:yes gene_type:complete
MKKAVQLYEDKVLESFYNAITSDSFKKVHVPHSKVFYVRAAVENRTGTRYSLAEIEHAMVAEGWQDSGSRV